MVLREHQIGDYLNQMSETEKNQDKQNNQKSKVPPRITNVLKNAETPVVNGQKIPKRF